MEQKESYLVKIFVDMVRIAALVVVLLLFVFSMVGDVYLDFFEWVYYVRDSVVLNLMVLVLVTGVFLFFHKKNIRLPLLSDRFIRIFTILYLIWMFLFVAALRLRPDADQKYCIDAASALLRGDASMWIPGGYMNYYPYQNGYVFYLLALFSLFGQNNYLLVQFMNVLTLVGSAKYLSKTAGAMFESKRLSQYTYLSALLFFPMNGYATFVYGTLPGLFLSLAGIYHIFCYIKEKRLKTGIIGSILLAVAYCFKSNYLLFILSALLMLCMDWIREKKKKTGVVVLACVTFCLLFSTAVSITAYKLTGQEKGGQPLNTYLLIGLQESTFGCGMYSEIGARIYEAVGYQTDTAKEVTRTLLENQIKVLTDNPFYTLRFFAKKTAGQWNEGTFGCFLLNAYRIHETECSGWVKFWMYDGYPGNALLKKLSAIGIMLFWFGLLLYFKRGENKDFYKCIFPVIFLAGFVFHILFEAKSQYTIVYVYIMLPYVLWGYRSVRDYLGQVFKEKSEWNIIFRKEAWLLILLLVIIGIRMIPGNPSEKIICLSEREEEYRYYISQLQEAVQSHQEELFMTEEYERRYDQNFLVE